MLSKTTTVFGCWEGEWSLSLELALHHPWAGEVVSFIGGREILKLGVENAEPTAAEELLTDLKGGSSLRMLLVVAQMVFDGGDEP